MKTFELTADYEQVNRDLDYDQALYIVENNLVDPCCSREDWVKLGTAMKSAGLDFEHFDRWSQESSDQYDAKNCQSTWNSFKENRSGIAYLVKEAKYQSNFDASIWTKEWYRQHGHRNGYTNGNGYDLTNGNSYDNENANDLANGDGHETDLVNGNGSYRASRPRTIQPNPKQSPQPNIKPPIRLENPITLVEPIEVTEPVKIPRSYGYDLEYKYWYSDDQFVKRVEYYDNEGKRIIPKGKKKDKAVMPYVVINGQEKIGKGDRLWPAYRLTEATTTQSKYVLTVEGEPCTDNGWLIRFPSISLQGAYKEKELLELAKSLMTAQKIPIIIPDNDQEGRNKAKKLARLFSSLGLDYLVFDLSIIWDKIPEKGDIVDWVTMMMSQGRCGSTGGARPPTEVGQILANHIESTLKAGYLPDWLEIEEDNNQANSETLREENSKVDKPQTPRSKDNNDYSRTKKENNNDNEKYFNPNEYGLPHWYQSEVATWIAAQFRQELAWNTEIGEWYRYGESLDGIWKIQATEYVLLLIQQQCTYILEQYKKILISLEKQEQIKKYLGFSSGFVNGVITLLKAQLAVKDWGEADELIPFKNGVLNLKSNDLLEHKPENYLTWCLPYDYNPLATCDPIQQWLLEMCQGDHVVVELIRAYLHGIVTGRTDWQKYLELIGPGGTGKSTLIRLAIALVGQQNVHTTTLAKLETSRFETASIKDKRLVVITDSERYTGGCSVLKALTGQDTLAYEQKHKQSREGFIPRAMVMVAANEIPQMADYTSGLERRRLTLAMTKRIEGHQQRDLMAIHPDRISGEFAPFIPGLLNWVLGMNPEEATQLIKNHSILTPSLEKMKAETLISTNPIAAWADLCLVEVPDNKIHVGSASKSIDFFLYASYHSYCLENGFKPVNNGRFSKLLHDLLVNQLKINTKRGRDNKGSYFTNLGIRSTIDSEKLLITKEYSTDDGDEGKVTVGVTVETPTGDSGEGDEGKLHINSFQTSPPPPDTVSRDKLNNPVITDELNESVVTDKGNDTPVSGKSETVINNQDLPSPPSPPTPTKVSAVTPTVTPTVTPPSSDHHQPDTQGERVSVESLESENVVQENEDIRYEDIRYEDIIEETNTHIERLEWTVEQGQEYLINTYGKRSRQLLSDKELLEFLEYLRNLDIPFKVGDRIIINKPEYQGLTGTIKTFDYQSVGRPTWWYTIKLENGKVLEEKINVNFLEPISG